MQSPSLAQEPEDQEGDTLHEISQVLERHVSDQASRAKLLEVLSLKKEAESDRNRECEICGRELELLQEIEQLCQEDVELKLLVFRKYLKVPLRTVISRPVVPVVRRIILQRSRNQEFWGGVQTLSPIFSRPVNYY